MSMGGSCQGQGYRVYFMQDAAKKIILLGGVKKTQSKDIEKAWDYSQDYRRKKMSKSTPYKDYLRETLKDPQEAAAYLDEALKDDDPGVFTLALRDVVDACGGGIAATARKTSLNREGLYRMLSEKGNPRFKNLNSLIGSLGLELHVMAKGQRKAPSIHPIK